jgi:apolipoprotein N-acyltransferase
LKQKLGQRFLPDAASLPYHEKFLAWLREEKKTGRKIILATASDIKLAQPVADHVGLFDEVLASNGRHNLRSEVKARLLVKKFGPHGFDYAGNSMADLAVWRAARGAVIVNASPRVRQLAAPKQTGPDFSENFSRFDITRRILGELFIRSRYLWAMLAGLVLALAFPKFNLAGFAWLGPALMVFAARGKTGADAFRVGCVSGFTFWLITLCWLLQIPYAGPPILGWLLLSAYCALFFGAWTWLISNFKFQISNWPRRQAWMLGGAAAWTALEFFRGWFLGGFPWSFLGCSQYKIVPLIQVAAFAGVFGVSFLAVWFSLALYAAAGKIIFQPGKRLAWQMEILFPLFVVIGCYVAGMHWMNFAPSTVENAARSLRVTSIQPSVPQTLIWSQDEDETRLHELVARTQAALTNATDLLLWPEAALPKMLRYDDETFRAVTNLAVTHRVWIVTASDDVEPAKNSASGRNEVYYNAAFLVSPEGQIVQRYCKQKLVIFGEYVPLERWLPFLKWFSPVEVPFTPGDKAGVFDLPNVNVRLAPLICFEDTFPASGRAVANAGDLDFLVNLTNDGWFGEASEQRQHLANSIFRAVETGLPLLRSCNNGVTCWVDEHGRLQKIFSDDHGGDHGPGAFTFDLPLRTAKEKYAPTFYQKQGNIFAWLCVAGTVWFFRAQRKTPR